MTSNPDRYVHAGPTVILPGRVAAFLESRLHLDEFRTRIRGGDPQIDAALVALHAAAKAWRSSATGTPHAVTPEPGPHSGWLTTEQAASRLGITSRGCGKPSSRSTSRPPETPRVTGASPAKTSSTTELG